MNAFSFIVLRFPGLYRSRTVEWSKVGPKLKPTVLAEEKSKMKTGQWLVVAILLLVAGVGTTGGQTQAAKEVTALLHEFMDAAGRSDRAVFEKFFADDVIYTRATGAVITKADIMKSLRTPPPPAEGKSTYSAEDITVHEYGETTVVAFRLEATTVRSDGKVEKARYRNTGTFVRKNGRWQVVAWQATKITEGPPTP
jgi:ketosteroid isomerase-like protein